MLDIFATPWTVACEIPLSRGFPRQEHWSGLPFPSPGDFSAPGIELVSPALQADSFTTEPQLKAEELLDPSLQNVSLWQLKSGEVRLCHTTCDQESHFALFRPQ